MRFLIVPAIFLSISSVHALDRCEAHFAMQEVIALTEPLKLRSEFIGEENGVWVENPQRIFGNSVTQNRVYVETPYFGEEEVENSVASISEDGRLISNYDAMNFIFVVTTTGELRVHPVTSNESSFKRIKHSSLVRGDDVLIAGEFELSYSGKIFRVTNKSGHYVPPSSYLDWFVNHFVPLFTSHAYKVKDESSRF